MNSFILEAGPDVGATSVPNRFLDHYMPRANGEYVKVYLCLLRALQRKPEELSVSGLADSLDLTESDVRRALKYWEKQRLLRLECDSSNTLKGIYLLEVLAEEPKTPASTTVRQARVQEAPQNTVPPKKSYTRDELSHFSSQAELKQLLFVCEQYLKKTLSPSEIETILYFYDQLHFSADLIEYLVEYCVCKGSRSIHYIETVALAWAEADISTVAQAKERTTTYTRGCFAVMKAFGINDRNPVDTELCYIEKWLRQYDFTMELILEACRRTMDRLHKPDFKYTDRILEAWSRQKVHTLEDVEALDMEHKKKSSARKKPEARPQAQATRFTNFSQRDYDFDELEKQLLESQ